MYYRSVERRYEEPDSMSKPNPFIPAGSLMAERERKRQARFGIAVYIVLAAHALLIAGFLIQGCKSDDVANSAPGNAAGPSQTQPGASGELVYAVKSGDTLGRIARAYGTTAQAIRSANGLKNDRLVVGQRLKMPPEASLTTPSALAN